MSSRQWPEVYDLCHTKRVLFSHVSVFSDYHNVQKRATISDTSGHCLMLRSNDFARTARRVSSTPACLVKVPLN